MERTRHLAIANVEIHPRLPTMSAFADDVLAARVLMNVPAQIALAHYAIERAAVLCNEPWGEGYKVHLRIDGTTFDFTGEVRNRPAGFFHDQVDLAITIGDVGHNTRHDARYRVFRTSIREGVAPDSFTPTVRAILRGAVGIIHQDTARYTENCGNHYPFQFDLAPIKRTG